MYLLVRRGIRGPWARSMLENGGCLLLSLRARTERGVDDNIRSRAVDDSFQFRLLLSGNRKFIQRLLKIVQECLPFRAGNLQMGV